MLQQYLLVLMTRNALLDSKEKGFALLIIIHKKLKASLASNLRI
jgi:hypothetical protein